MPERSPLELHLIGALRAIDSQVAREMQRQPSEREAHGVQKWVPYSKRVEAITGWLLNSLGEGEIDLDGLFVLSQALPKALRMAVEDLGANGLGSVRSGYARATGTALTEEARGIVDALGERNESH